MLTRVMSLGTSAPVDGASPQAMSTVSKVEGVHIPIDMRLSIGGQQPHTNPGDVDHAPSLRASGTSYSDHFYRHNEALRQRTQANHGALPKSLPESPAGAFPAPADDNLHAAPSTFGFRNRGPYGWNDPLDVLVLPLERFFSKPECLPLVVVFTVVATLGGSAAVFDGDRTIFGSGGVAAVRRHTCITRVAFQVGAGAHIPPSLSLSDLLQSLRGQKPLR